MPIMNSFGGLKEQHYSIATNPATTGSYAVLYTTTSSQGIGLIAPKAHLNEINSQVIFVSDTGYVKLNSISSNISNNQTLWFTNVSQVADVDLIDVSGNYLFVGYSVYDITTSGTPPFAGITGVEYNHSNSVYITTSVLKSNLNRYQAGAFDNGNSTYQGVILEINTANALVYSQKIDIDIGNTVTYFSSNDMVRDSSNNLYVCGVSAHSFANGTEYGFVYKLDSSGNMVWIKQFPACSHFEEIVLSRDQTTFYLTGGATYDYTGVGSPGYYQDGPPSGSVRPGYIMMGSTSTGAMTTQLSLDGDGTYGYYPTSIYIGADDNVYVAGTVYNYNWDVAGQLDYSYCFVMVLDSALTAVSWSRLFKFESTITGYGTAINTNFIRDIMADTTNSHILITGSTKATYTGGFPTNEVNNPFLVRLPIDGTGTGTYSFTYRTLTYSSFAVTITPITLTATTPTYTLASFSDTLTSGAATASLTAQIAVSQKVNI